MPPLSSSSSQSSIIVLSTLAIVSAFTLFSAAQAFRRSLVGKLPVDEPQQQQQQEEEEGISSHPGQGEETRNATLSITDGPRTSVPLPKESTTKDIYPLKGRDIYDEDSSGVTHSTAEESTTVSHDSSSSTTAEPLAVPEEALAEEAPSSEVETDTKIHQFRTIRVSRLPIELDLHYETRTYLERAKYSGPLVNGHPHGAGILWFDNGSMYVGEFDNGEMHGAGAFNYKRKGRRSSEVYRGEFVHNEFMADLEVEEKDDAPQQDGSGSASDENSSDGPAHRVRVRKALKHTIESYLCVTQAKEKRKSLRESLKGKRLSGEIQLCTTLSD